jgi:hypothetical protein
VQPEDVRPRVVPDRIRRGLRDRDECEVQVREQQSLHDLGQWCSQLGALRAVDPGMTAAQGKELLLGLGVAEHLVRGLADKPRRREHEGLSLHRVDPADRGGDVRAERGGDPVVDRETRPGADVDLLVEAVHRVLRQRLHVLPAVEPTQPAEARVVHLDVTAVALAENAALDVRRLQLAPHGDDPAGVVDECLRHVQRAVLALAEAEDHVDSVLAGRGRDPLHLRPVAGDRVFAVARDESHAVDAVDHDRFAPLGHVAGEAASHRYPDLREEPVPETDRGDRDQVPATRLVQQHRAGVDVKDGAGAFQRRLERSAEVQVRRCRTDDLIQQSHGTRFRRMMLHDPTLA